MAVKPLTSLRHRLLVNQCASERELAHRDELAEGRVATYIEGDDGIPRSDVWATRPP